VRLRGLPVRLGQFIVTPETRSALLAVRRIAKAVETGKPPRESSPLFLHGPPGVGKSHLAAGLLSAVSETKPPRTARLVAAGDLSSVAGPEDDGSWQELAAADLLIIEDVQHLSTRAEATAARLIDRRMSRGQALVLTANAGPAQLRDLPPRLTSLLSAGLVIGLELPSRATRRYLLERFAQRERLATAPGVLDWLAEKATGGVRPLLGAVTTLAALSVGSPLPPELPMVQRRWPESNPTPSVPSVQRIVQHVAKYYALEAKDLKSRSRQSRTLWPLQVAMFLVRERTGLPWTRIGDALGGRDPSTVRHAVRKVAQLAGTDPATASALRQLSAEVA
jgi:chromosomal replication initiator protein